MIGSPSDGTTSNIEVLNSSGGGGIGEGIPQRRKFRRVEKKRRRKQNLRWLQKNSKSHKKIGYRKKRNK